MINEANNKKKCYCHSIHSIQYISDQVEARSKKNGSASRRL